MSEVFLNGRIAGEVDDSADFIAKLKSERRRGAVSGNINVHFNESTNQVFVECGRGRVRRPLIVVKDSIPLLTDKHIKQLQKNEISWNDLVAQGVIEYLDAGEEENALVAFSEKELTPQHTHLEISPLVMLGLCTALVPYGDYIQSARLRWEALLSSISRARMPCSPSSSPKACARSFP